MRKVSSTEYGTPQPFFDTLNAEFHFTLDACASATRGALLKTGYILFWAVKLPAVPISQMWWLSSVLFPRMVSRYLRSIPKANQ